MTHPESVTSGLGKLDNLEDREIRRDRFESDTLGSQNLESCQYKPRKYYKRTYSVCHPTLASFETFG